MRPGAPDDAANLAGRLAKGCTTKKWQRPGVLPIACQSVWLVGGARIPARRPPRKHGGETPTVSPARLRAARWATELLGKVGG